MSICGLCPGFLILSLMKGFAFYHRGTLLADNFLPYFGLLDLCLLSLQF